MLKLKQNNAIEEKGFTSLFSPCRGRIARDAWVFGILFTQFTPVRGYFKVMRRQNAATLLPIIQRCVLSGTEGFFVDWGVNFVFAFYVR